MKYSLVILLRKRIKNNNINRKKSKKKLVTGHISWIMVPWPSF